MLPPNPAMLATAKNLRIASVLTIILIVAAGVFAIWVSNSCNIICTDIQYFFQCYINGDLQGCNSSYCSGLCSLTGLNVATGIYGLFLLISTMVMFDYACRLRSMRRQAMRNGHMGLSFDSNGNMFYPNPHYNNNQPLIYGNNQPLIYDNNPPNQVNPYQQGNNNYVAPQSYNQQ